MGNFPQTQVQAMSFGEFFAERSDTDIHFWDLRNRL